MSAFLVHDQVTMLEAQLSNSGWTKKIYTDDFKELAISILFKSSSAYGHLAKILRLPPERTVRK